VIARIGAAKLLPVLRLDSTDRALSAVDACLEAGLSVVELTTTTLDWESLLEQVTRSHPGVLVGLGTVTRPEQARRGLDRGAHFLVSPFPVPAVRAALPPGTVLIEGGMTVREVVEAAGHGVAKLFPAHVGGPSFLRSVRAIAPQARIVPTGGITLAEVPAWLEAGAYAVGIGTDLVRRPDIAAAVREALDRAAELETGRSRGQATG
jgi:2-dehydro-3-deoxyphosphogluconate aldolase/(4S)-4-hydroxy-2-oxoglutarate aldolase